MYSCLFAIFILLLNLKYGNFRPVGIECDWSIERLQCPPYGTTDWECLKARLKCSSGKEYHCVRDLTGKWIQICAEAKTCHKGQEPVYSKVSGITCQSCSNPERFEPVESTASYKFSECRRIKKTCPEDISHECPDEALRYIQNRMCRCANEKNFIPQNYDFDTETWICKDPDDLNCVEDACPEDVNGKKQIRRTDYRCYVPPVLPSTPSPADRSSPCVITEKPTTRLNRIAGPVEGDKSPPGFVKGVILLMLVLLLLNAVVILSIYMLKKRNQLGTPVALKASDITYHELLLSWEPPLKGYLPTHYILEKREAKSLSWCSIDTIPAEQTEYHVTELKAETFYSFSVVAKSKKGTSKRHEIESPVQTKCITSPTIPPSLTGKFDMEAKCLQLAWEAPTDDGGTAILDYLVEYCSYTDSDEMKAETVSKSKTMWTKSNLIGGMKYNFRVSARNEVGLGEHRELEEPLTFCSEPSKPTEIAVKDVKSDKVILTWKAPENNGGLLIERYHIRQKEDGNDWHPAVTVRSSITSQRVIKLIPEKTYHFGVCAENAIGNGEFIDTKEAIVLPKSRGPPNKPAGPLTVSDIGYTMLTLSWQPPLYDGGYPLKGYVIYEKRFVRLNKKLGETGPKETKFSVLGLNANTDYCFLVCALNDKGNSDPLEVRVTTNCSTIPGKPVGPIKCTRLTANSVTLSWKPPSDDGGAPISGYNIECYAFRDKYFICSATVSKDQTTFTQKGLLEMNEYLFKLFAANTNGRSEPLESENAVIPKQQLFAPSQPIALTIKDIKEDRLTLTWIPPKNVGGSQIKKYHICMLEDGFLREKVSVASSITTYEILNLVPGKQYHFEVLAENGVGQSEATRTKTPVVLQKKSSSIIRRLTGRSTSSGKELKKLPAPTINKAYEATEWSDGDEQQYSRPGKEETKEEGISERKEVSPEDVPLTCQDVPPHEDKSEVLKQVDAIKEQKKQTEKKQQQTETEADKSDPTQKPVSEFHNPTENAPDNSQTNNQKTDTTDKSNNKTRATPKETKTKESLFGGVEKGFLPGSNTNSNPIKKEKKDRGEVNKSSGDETQKTKGTLEDSSFVKKHDESEKLKIPEVQEKMNETSENLLKNQGKTEGDDNMDHASWKAAVASVEKKDFGKTHPSRKLDPGGFVSGMAKMFGHKGTEPAADPTRSHSMRISSKNDTQEIAKKVSAKDSAADSLDQVDDGKVDGEDKAGSLKDWEKQEERASEFLNVIGVAKKSTSWDDLKTYGSVNKHLNDGCKVPATPLQQLIGTKYKIGKGILPKDLEAYEVSGKDNFLFKSVSCALFGNENFTQRLRLKTVFDGIDNCNVYVNQYFKDKDKDSIRKFMSYCLSDESLKELDHDKEENVEYLAEFTIQMAVRETAIPEHMNNPLQVQFLSNTIDVPILQYFQGNKNFFGEPVVDECELATPAGMIDSVKECVRILWAHDTKLGKSGLKGLNYIVPVAKKADSKQKS